MHELLADIILSLHVVFIAFVVLAVPYILIGAKRYWPGVHRPLFRLSHLAAIGVVVAESLLGIACPLTLWEHNLRLQAQQQGYSEKGMIADFVHGLVFYDLPTWVFTLAYCLFASSILWLCYAVPIHFRKNTPDCH